MHNTFTSLRTLALLTLGLGALPAAHAALVPVAVTGYNADVVANGAGTVISSTTDDVDGGAVGNRFNFMASTFVSPTSGAPTSFLPANGSFTSAVTSGLTFQFASYSANNSLRISGIGSGTLAFPTPLAASDVYLLATSGNGASGFTATVTFTDGTTQAFTGLSAADWFSGTTNIALRGFGRVGRDNNTIQNSTTDPRLYEFRLTLSAANATKSIQNIVINKPAATGTLNVMGVTVNATLAATLPAREALAVNAYPNPTANALTVQAPAEASPAATVLLLDHTGRTLQAAPVRNHEARFDLGSLAAGLYLVRYQDGDRTRTLKVVKQ
ncbi:T9SS type A sorting domain-containing protein [Hymenobacter properus]|uniref:T9SS type A sorting domain-containing protein n=1 Tax=Hymenobacter properus TaxID=2791026 RepID=A0A931BMU0_9BACT|nr:T9SS type A sorting domain-containing protein [Hymenobacter properus]MBF9144322.1 T9SS type A sorting domain-containing protein [Hymenobacter properus]MBR7723140.1 T9SS type A sorting domain-containing protein [Microvirga sp. SRT04]